MRLISRKLVVIVLMLCLGAGSTAQAASRVLNCLPKRCCCAADAQEMVDPVRFSDALHEVDHTTMPAMPMGDPCAARPVERCCHVEPFPFETDVAVPPAGDKEPVRSVCEMGAACPTDDSILPDKKAIRAFFVDPRLKIPQVPIFLHVQAILC